MGPALWLSRLPLPIDVLLFLVDGLLFPADGLPARRSSLFFAAGWLFLPLFLRGELRADPSLFMSADVAAAAGPSFGVVERRGKADRPELVAFGVLVDLPEAVAPGTIDRPVVAVAFAGRVDALWMVVDGRVDDPAVDEFGVPGDAPFGSVDPDSSVDGLGVDRPEVADDCPGLAERSAAVAFAGRVLERLAAVAFGASVGLSAGADDCPGVADPGETVDPDLSESVGVEVELLLFSEVLVDGSVLSLLFFCSGFMDFMTAVGGLPEGSVLALLFFPCRTR